MSFVELFTKSRASFGKVYFNNGKNLNYKPLFLFLKVNESR